MFFHNKSMLKYITTYITKWMSFHKNQFISLNIMGYSAFPIRRFWATIRNAYFSSSFLRHHMTFSKHIISFISIFIITFGVYNSKSFAGFIDLPSYLSGNDVQISSLNTTNTTIENEFNGGIEGGGINIAPGTITSVDLANSISPVKRWDEAFNDFTPSGMLAATDSDLTSDISAGVSYVNGLRIEKNAEAHTYTASKDTYAYISQTGSYVFEEVANGASAPSTPANSLLLFKAVTSGTAITSVSDLRTTTIQITAASTNFPSHFRERAGVSWDTTTTMHVEPGNLAIGTTIYTRTSNTSAKNVTTATNWIEGAYQGPGTPNEIFIYAYNDSGSTFDFKYSSADPVYADTSLNSVGTLRYYVQGGTTYRAIGWAYLSNDAIQVYEHGNIRDGDAQNAVERTGLTGSSNVSTTDAPIADMSLKFYSTGGWVNVNLSQNTQATASSFPSQVICVDGISRESTRFGGLSDNAGSATLFYGKNSNLRERLSQGIHTISGKARTNTSTWQSITRQLSVSEE